ncbi:MAG: GC-type dockerin domain-anchored protein [Phycisphaerales bacterium JB060]
MKPIHTTMSIAVALAMWAMSARAQDILYARTFDFISTPVIGGLAGLELDFTFVVTFEDFLGELRGQEWDLVIVRGFIPFSAALEGDILTELEAHVARGGALHFQMAELDRASTRYYDLLGLEGAVELELPLRPLDPIAPRHPSMPFSGLPVFNESYPPDYGDELVPAAGSRAIIRFEDAGDCTVVSNGGRVIANGLQWDNWSLGGVGIAREQIRWLLRCPADLDLDGTLTIRDFLVFQNLFAVGDPSVDFDGDGTLTIFDFLEYLNAFDAGCP